jgi:hypothetical protein
MTCTGFGIGPGLTMSLVGLKSYGGRPLTLGFLKPGNPLLVTVVILKPKAGIVKESFFSCT